MTTSPQYYEAQLSAEAQQHREAVEKHLSELYENLESLTGIQRLKRLRDVNALEQQLDWQGANPKRLPFEELREHIREGRPNSDVIEKKYQARIKNRATAIRAFCVACQGGFVAGVKECVSVTCPLHPFRMGKDPFRGWDIPKVTDEPEIPEEELVGDFEDGEDGDVDDNE